MSVAREKATDFSCVTTKNITMKGANFLEKLLDGQKVEWKKLGEVAENLDNLRRPVTGNNRVAGEYPYYGASGIVDYVDNYIFDGDYLLISEDGANLTARKTPIAFSISGKNWVNNHAHVLKFETYVERKFVEYYLNNLDISEYVSGAAQPKLNQANLNRIPIPIPPLSVQSRIVEILDKFTVMEAELEEQLQAELELRKKQYQHYREQLLNFSYTPPSEFNVVYKKLGEICTKVCSGGTPSTSNPEYYKGNIPWLRTQDVDWKDVYDTDIKITEEAIKHSSAQWIPANCVIVAMYGATAAKACINRIPLTTNQACCNLQVDENIAHYKYVYHWICREYERLRALGEGSQSNLSGKKIKDYKIPLPPLSEQARIVEILDKFDTLTNSISEGLPLEIQLRRQQYEYYREQLLAFPHP